MKVIVLIEKGKGGYGAFSPDVPNIVAAGATGEEALERFRSALILYRDMVRNEGRKFPEPRMMAVTLEIDDVA